MQVHIDRGLQALHASLVAAIRHQGGRVKDIDGIASALSLMLVGHNASVEDHVRWAARKARDQFTPGMSEQAVANMFLAYLPVTMFDEPVRQRFFAPRYQDTEISGDIAYRRLLHWYATEHACRLSAPVAEDGVLQHENGRADALVRLAMEVLGLDEQTATQRVAEDLLDLVAGAA